jgi:hypothetical protein
MFVHLQENTLLLRNCSIMQVVVVDVVGQGPLLDCGLLLSFHGVHRLVSEVLMMYCPFQLVSNQIVT